MTAKGQINGVEATLFSDTGAGLSWVSESFARRAGLEIFAQTITVNDANAKARVMHMGMVREIRLGSLTVNNVAVFVGSSFPVQMLTGTDAIIGWDVLQHVDVTWDFPNRLMTLKEPRCRGTTQPKLFGRLAPVFGVISSTGRQMHLMLDTGALGSRRKCLTVFDNSGILATKVDSFEFRRSYWPTLNGSFSSASIVWPRRAAPFSFWMNYRFEVATAVLESRDYLQEHLFYIDGVVGNLPFLSGKLRICGVTRELEFEPGQAKGRQPNKAPEPTTGSVTLRAPSR